MLSVLRRIYYRVLNYKRRSYLRRLIDRGLKIGTGCEIHDGFFFDPSHCFLISIGDNCVLGPNVRLIAHDASPKKWLGYAKIGKIEIGNNCFLGDSVIVLPGVTIGHDSVIGAGAVVTKDIPPNSIAVGNPARIVSSVPVYVDKIKSASQGKKIFGPEYYINRLDQAKRSEVLAAVETDIGYMV